MPAEYIIHKSTKDKSTKDKGITPTIKIQKKKMPRFSNLVLLSVCLVATAVVADPSPSINFALHAKGASENAAVGAEGGAPTIDDAGNMYLAFDTSESFNVGSITFPTKDAAPARTHVVKFSPSGTAVAGAYTLNSGASAVGAIFPRAMGVETGLPSAYAPRVCLTGAFNDLEFTWVSLTPGLRNLTFQQAVENLIDDDGSANCNYVVCFNSTNMEPIWGAIITSPTDGQHRTTALVVDTPRNVVYVPGWFSNNAASGLVIRAAGRDSTHNMGYCDPVPGILSQTYLAQFDLTTGNLKAILCQTSGFFTFIHDVAVDSTGQVYVVGATHTSAWVTHWQQNTTNQITTGTFYDGFILALGPDPVSETNKNFTIRWVMRIAGDSFENVDSIVVEEPSGNLFISGSAYASTFVDYGDKQFTPSICGTRGSTDGEKMIDLSSYTTSTGAMVVKLENTPGSATAPTHAIWLAHLCGDGSGSFAPRGGGHRLRLDAVSGYVWAFTYTGQNEWAVVAFVNDQGTYTNITGCCGGPSYGAQSSAIHKFHPHTGGLQFSCGIAGDGYGNQANGGNYDQPGVQSFAINPLTGGTQIAFSVVFRSAPGTPQIFPRLDTNYQPAFGAFSGTPNSISHDMDSAGRLDLTFVSITDFCARSNPCQHGGTCQNQPNGFICNCVPGYSGLECQTGC
jgi:hypothetical protein